MSLFGWLLRRKLVLMLVNFGLPQLLLLAAVFMIACVFVTCLDVVFFLAGGLKIIQNLFEYTENFLLCLAGVAFCLALFVFAMVIYNERYVEKSDKDNNES